MVVLPPPPALSPPHDATGPALWRRQHVAALAGELGGVVVMRLRVALGPAPLEVQNAVS